MRFKRGDAAIGMLSRFHRPSLMSIEKLSLIFLICLSIPLSSGAQSGQTSQRNLNSRQDFIINIGDRIFFERRSKSITKTAKFQLKKIILYLAENKNAVLSVEGYADTGLGTVADSRLSKDRASITYQYLVSHGTPPEQIGRYIGLGNQEKLAFCDDAACWAMNNRVVFRLEQQ